MLIVDPVVYLAEETMRLHFKKFDGRSSNAYSDVIDTDTGERVGHITSNGVGFNNLGGIRVSLFDGKYEQEVNSYQECQGFVAGVQSVLNHMTYIPQALKKTNTA